MIRRSIPRFWLWAALAFIFGSLIAPQAVQADKTLEQSKKQAEERTPPLIIQAARYDVSPSLESVTPVLPKETLLPETPVEIPSYVLPKALKPADSVSAPETTILEDVSVTDEMPTPIINFEGVNNRFGGWPPDTQGDIGPNHYIQWVNLHFAIWEIDRQNLTANLVYGPVTGNTLFQGFGGVCEYANDGDPITLYDPFDNRWFMSQFALPNFPNGPFYQCIAVSATSNPLGAWHRYEYEMPVNKMNDYPKFGVWPNAYFMSINQYNAGSLSWGGAAVAAFERAAMLIGGPARMVFFDLYTVNPDFGGILPADYDGRNSPPPGSPGYFAGWDDGAWIGGSDALRIWEFNIDWNHPSEASFGESGQPNWVIPTTDVDPTMCNMQRNCIPQPGTTTGLDAISDRLMYRLQYRNFGGYASLVSNHTVDVGSVDHAGIHWFELRKNSLGVDWYLEQEGIYAPDSHHRWMGSAALDHVGNLALGYSVSSATVFPSVRYTGRLSGDPLGSLTQGERVLITGTGSQTGSSRWGDYSMMGVDPVDDCTFWFTQEYVAVTGSNTWRTRIGAFRFPGCSVGPQGEMTGSVTVSGSGNPLENARISARLSPTQSFTTQTNSDGLYRIVAPVGSYDLEAYAYGYFPQTISAVDVLSGTTTVQNFSLEQAPMHVLSGIVSDALAGWPLYAKITAVGVERAPVWSNPETGYYQIELPEGAAYALSVEAFSAGYLPRSVSTDVLLDDLDLDIALMIDEDTCNAPGYLPEITSLYSTDFEDNSGGLTSSGFTSWAWGTINSGPGIAHSGTKGWATNLSGNYLNNEDGHLILPVLDLSGLTSERPALRWWQWLDLEARYDFARIDASKDGGSSWQTIYGPESGVVDTEWAEHILFLDPSFAVSNLLIRFRFTSDVSVTFPGWYLDDLEVGAGSCQPQAGSLVIGQVRDANTLQGIPDAEVTNDLNQTVLSQSTPMDPNQGDGFFTLFTPAGTHVFTATFGTAYAPAQHTLQIPTFATLLQDFELQAGWLDFSPAALQTTLSMGETLTKPLTLTNAGGISLQFEMLETRSGMVPLGNIEAPAFLVKPFKGNYPTGEDLGIPAGPDSPPLAAGDLIQSWTPGDLAGAWGVTFDSLNQTVWVSSPAPSWGGSDQLLEFSQSGIATGRVFLHTIPHNSGPADLTTNWHTGNLWIMNINTGIANCIYEIDPDQGYTGAKICPGGATGFENSQRGLAYDPDSDTWFAGSWNDLMIHRFDSTGMILESVNVGLATAGLAYNPETGHLFVLTNEALTRVYVLDVKNQYQIRGSFAISDGFGFYAGGGLEFDCDGNLWAVDLVDGRIVQFESGETASLCDRDVPWITAEPVSGTIEPSVNQPVTITFDAGSSLIDQPGDYLMQFKLREDTPYLVPNLPVTMTVEPPPTWGKLEGVVQSLGYCDQDLHPIPNAIAEITDSGGNTWTTYSSSDGHYQRWLDEAGSPYTVTVSAPDHQAVQQNGVIVSAGLTTTLNLELPWLVPCVNVSPDHIDFAIKTGRTLTQTLSIENLGHADSPYLWSEFVEENGQPTQVELDWLSVEPQDGSLIAGAGSTESIISFDASTPNSNTPGVYTAGLILETSDPVRNIISVPLTMTVLPLEYGVTISPDQTSQEIPGLSVLYTMTITNTSEGLTDTISLHLGAHTWSAHLSTSSVGPLASGAAETFTVEVMIPESALPGQTEVLEVIAGSIGDPSKTAAANLTTIVLQPEADLALDLSSSSDPAWVGLPLTYTMVITNYGPTAAPHGTLIGVLSTKLTFLSDDSDGICSLTGTVLSCDLGTMRIGEVRTIRIAVRPILPGLLVYQSLAVSEAQDPDNLNNFGAIHSVVEGNIYFLPLIWRN